MKHVLYFSLGVVIGACSGYYFAKKHYENLADEEVASVKEMYEERIRVKESVEKVKEEANYISKENGYVVTDVMINPTDMVNVDFPREEAAEEPYVIGPEVYEEDYHGFDKINLTYWKGNDCLTNEDLEELDIGYYIGRDCLERFGEYEAGTVFVRNEQVGADFEVLLEEGAFETD